MGVTEPGMIATREPSPATQRSVRTRSRRLWLFRTIAFFGAMLVGLLIAEAVVRVWQPIPPLVPDADTAIVLYYSDPNGPISLTPNWKGYVGYAWTEVNSQGFRDRLYPSEPPPGTVRIAILGDSYTMGDAVVHKDTYPKQLESLLAEKHPVEVMNCGVSATNTRNQVHVLKRVLDEFHPHLVVIGYNINDFQSYKKTRFERYEDAGYSFVVGPDGRVKVAKELSWAQSVKSFVSDRSYLYRWLASIRKRPEGYGKSKVETVQGWIDEGGAELSFNALAQMREMCAQKNASLLVAIIPDQIDIPPNILKMDDYPFQKEHERIREATRVRSIDCVDLFPDFAGQDMRQLAAHPFDRHYSPLGNEIIARALLKHLEPRLAKIEKKTAVGSR
jgi:hypothetical protein